MGVCQVFHPIAFDRYDFSLYYQPLRVDCLALHVRRCCRETEPALDHIRR